MRSVTGTTPVLSEEDLLDRQFLLQDVLSLLVMSWIRKIHLIIFAYRGQLSLQIQNVTWNFDRIIQEKLTVEKQ